MSHFVAMILILVTIACGQAESRLNEVEYLGSLRVEHAREIGFYKSRNYGVLNILVKNGFKLPKNCISKVNITHPKLGANLKGIAIRYGSCPAIGESMADANLILGMSELNNATSVAYLYEVTADGTLRTDRLAGTYQLTEIGCLCGAVCLSPDKDQFTVC